MKNPDSRRASALILSLIVMFSTIALAAAFLSTGAARFKQAVATYDNLKTLYAADSAVSAAMNSLNGGGDGNIGSATAPVTFQGGTYYATTVDNGDDTYTINTTAAFSRYSVKIETLVQRIYGSAYDNAIMAGEGQSGAVINGNATIHGGLFIFGEKPDGTGDVSASTVVASFSGTGGVRDNYSGVDATLLSKIPSLDSSYPLSTEVRIKNGRIDLSGTGTVGESNDAIDGLYVGTGGIGGNQGTPNIYSDNGSSTTYDVVDSLNPPSLTESFKDGTTTYANYAAYVAAKGFDLSTKVNLGTLRGDGSNTVDSDTPSFVAGDGVDFASSTSAVQWDQATQSLTIKGVVRMGSTLTIGKKNDSITYSGKGIFYVDSSGGGDGSVNVHADILPKTKFAETDVLGIIANKDINLATGPGDSQLKMALLMFAEGTFVSAKQNQIAGTVIARYFDMGSNVPKMIAVPKLKDNLPSGWVYDGRVPGRVITVYWQLKG